ncbi:mechanosensitive ion channel family protein [Mucilaginibacter ginkgonis]|uniref:Mechanosensitive ion channel family protein n=1 Tax=Mucilaginibacter ginkgonis TaxID=2682091 RepID=A0A6I4I7K4_9SPHI|nr:mechanosensitive ion channel family protein [Mucilaginibacter ginkgonis]QQL49149.1 mechanosensitive ion channel family protein [Mucilaginibacter ginkgonis]
MKQEFNLAKFYDNAYDWVLHYGPRLIVGILVLFAGLWLIRMLLNWSHNKMHRKNVDPTIKPFLLDVFGVALRLILVLAVMQIVGIQMTLFATLVGTFGVAVGLALSGTLQNFASGLLILLLKPFIVGDNIITQGLEGTVTSIQLFYTLVKTFDNRDVIVPNSKLSNEVIINISREGSRRLDIQLKFGKDIPLAQVRDVVNKAIDKCENVLATPERRIGVGEIQPDGYLLNVNVWVNAHGFQDTRLQLNEKLLEDLEAAQFYK